MGREPDTGILFVGSGLLEWQMASVSALSGLALDTATHSELTRRLLAEVPRIVILDGDEQLDVFQAGIRSARSLSQVPLIALVSTEVAGIDALRLGADAIVPRPVNLEELRLKIGSVLQRAERSGGPELYDDGLIELDRVRHRVSVRGKPVDLTPTEFRLLAALVDHPGIVLSHERLLELVWADAFHDRTEVKLYVSYLRRKLDLAGVSAIETVRGIGYRYAPPPS